MNKDKLTKWINEEKKKLIWQHNNIGECQSECIKAIEELNKVKSFIQSEPEETKPIEIKGVQTNFNVITETPEKLAESIFNLAADYLDECDSSFEDYALKWLNEKAGE